MTGKFKGLGAAISAGFSGTVLAGMENFTGKMQKSISPTEKFVASVKGIAPGMATAIPVSSRFGIALGTVARGLLVASPVIAAVTAGIAAYATNAFGARDAANEFGASLGNTLQIFKPFGELLVGIAGKLGLTGESADQVAIHFEKAGQGFANMSTLWHNTIQGLITSSDEFSQKVGQNLLKASTAVETMSSDFVKQIGMTANAWSTFISQLDRQDYKGAVDSIGMAFAALPGIITTAISEFGDLMDGLWGVVEPALQQFATNAMGILGEIAKRISDKFWSELQAAWNNASGLVGLIAAFANNFNQQLGSAFSQIGSQIQGWIKTNITEPINGFVKLITVKASEIWGQITTGAAAIASQVTTWVNGNIVEPINQFIQNISVTASEIWTQISQGASSVIGQVTTWVNTNIVDPIDKFIDNISVTAGQIWTQIVQGAGSIASQVMTWVNGNIVEPINKFVANITVTAQSIWAKIVGGAGSIAGTVMTWVNGNIVNPINQLYNNVVDQASSIVQKLLSSDPINQIISWATSVANKIGAEVLKALKPITDPINKLFPGLGDVAKALNLPGSGTGTGGQSAGKIAAVAGGSSGGTGTGTGKSGQGGYTIDPTKSAAQQTFDQYDQGVKKNIDPNKSALDQTFGSLFGTAYGAQQPGIQRVGLGNQQGGTGFTFAQQQAAIKKNRAELGEGTKLGAGGFAGVGAGPKPNLSASGDISGAGSLTPGEIKQKQQQMDMEKARRNASLPEAQLTKKLLPFFQGMDKKKQEEIGFPEATVGEGGKTDNTAQTNAISDMIFKYKKLIPLEEQQKMTVADLGNKLVALEQIYGEASTSIEDNKVAQSALSTALGDTAYQQNLVTLGAQDQAGKYQNLQADIFKNVGAIGEYNKQLNDQKFQQDNVTAGMQAQQISL